jgi:hypothetical protein
MTNTMLSLLSAERLSEYLLQLNALPLTTGGKMVKRDLADLVNEGKVVPRQVRFSSLCNFRRTAHASDDNATRAAVVHEFGSKASVRTTRKAA